MGYESALRSKFASIQRQKTSWVLVNEKMRMFKMSIWKSYAMEICGFKDHMTHLESQQKYDK